MSHILFAWELGGGLGHVAPYVETIRQLTAKGHEVSFALRDLSRAETILALSGATYLQAPALLKPIPQPIPNPYSYPQILHNVGYHDPNTLLALVKAWRRLIELVRPDVLVADHSPTALLASRLTGVHRVIAGTGFTVPPPLTPMPNMRFWSHVEPEFLSRFEDRMLGNINTAMRQLGVKSLDKVADVIDAEAVVLRTLPELDHYPSRPAAEYWGIWPTMRAAPPVWPATTRPGGKIFAYLKPSRDLPAVLQALRQLGRSSIVYLESKTELLIGRYGAPHINFVDHPQDISRVAEECDLAVLNVNHDTMAYFLLSGKPIFMLPLTLEQFILSKNVERLGAGVGATTADTRKLAPLLESMNGTDSYRLAAQGFALKHASRDKTAMQDRFLSLIEGGL